MVQPPAARAIVIDGHHRFLAYRKLGRPVKAYVGYVDKVTPEMLETHSSQIHSGKIREHVKLAEFTALCDREWKNQNRGGRGDVVLLTLTEASAEGN